MSAQVIGYLGENGVRDVRIPIGHLLDKWQGLRPSLVMVPVGGSDDEAYPVQYKLEGTDLVWQVSDADTAVAGTTKAAVRMVDDGGRVGMDEPFQVIISPNLSAGGEPPVVIKPWVDKLATLVPRAEAAAERAENAAQNWENGTAPNALALDGKPPSCYLPVQNLLVNPDFAIAQAGYGGLHGAEKYAADRWMIDRAVCAKVTSGLSLAWNGTESSNGYIVQKVFHAFETGKTYTIAAKIDGTISVFSFQYSDGIDKVGYHSDGKRFCRFLAENKSVTFYVTSTTPVIVQWAALYEGTYTAETMPTHVPNKYAAELLECQRYCLVFETNDTYETILATGYTDSSFARFEIDLAVPMRIDSPSISIDSGIVFGVRYNGTYVQVDNVVVQKAIGKKLYLQANGSFTKGHVATLVCYTDSWPRKKIVISSDL